MAIQRSKITNSNKMIDVASLLRSPQYSGQVLNQMFEVIVRNIVRDTINAIIDDTSGELSTKINRVMSAEENKFAAWTDIGTLKDSGKSAVDFEPAGAVSEHNTDTEAHSGLLDTKADKVESATEGNFAELDAEGNLADSGKKAADFAAATHAHEAGDITTGALGIANGGTGATTAAEAFDSINQYKRTQATGTSSNRYTKIADLTAVQYAVSEGLLYLQDVGSADTFGILRVGMSGTGSTFNSTGFYWLVRKNLQAYVVMTGATTAALYIKMESQWQVTYYGFLGRSSSITLANEQPLLSALPAAAAHTAVYMPRREISTSVTLNSIVTQYEVDVSWAVTGMWFEAIRTDAIMTYFLHPIRAFCESAGKVKVYLNAYPDAALNGTSMGLKISGWM